MRNKRGKNLFRLGFEEGVPVEQCLAECTAQVDCAGVSHRAGETITLPADALLAVFVFSTAAAAVVAAAYDGACVADVAAAAAAAATVAVAVVQVHLSCTNGPTACGS
jgi:hypothetical protein